MNIAYVTNMLTAVGGGGTNANRLCRALSARPDIELTAIHAGGTDAPENFWSMELGYEALYPRSLESGLDAVDADLVLVHAFNVSMLDWLEEYAKDDDAVYCFRHGVNVTEQWLTLNEHGQPDRLLHPLYELDWFDAIFAPSKAASERIAMHYGNAAPHLSVAPCVIEYDQYVPDPWYDEPPLKVITASRIAPNNYILSPLLAMRRLITSYDVEMEILSAGQAAFTHTVNQVAGGMDEVRVIGHVSPDKVRAYLEHADVVCIPSFSHQAVPTLAIEAMAAGCVVLSGAYHTVNEADSLIRVPTDHPPSWHHALSDIIESPADGREIMRESIQEAKKYDVEHVLDESYIPMFHLLVEEYGE